MEGGNDQERDRAQLGVDYSAVEGDGDRGRYSLLVRCASQSSLDESSQRPAGDAGEDAAAPAHASKLLDALSRLRRDATLCDVQLQAQLESADEPSAGVWAHRAVLAAASPYFLAMFTQFDERTQASVTIQNIEPQALEAIVEYIYNPESLVITEDNVQSLLSGASLVQVWGVRAACCGFLATALAPDNALGIRAFAELHACAELARAAQRYIDAHTHQVLETEEFLALAPDVLCQLLDSDRITVPNEEVILDAVIRWMQHDAEVRQQQLGAVLEHVRLPLLPQDVLVARAAAEPLVSAGIRVKDLVIEALSFHLLRPERRAAAAAGCVRARARAGARAAGAQALLVVGGQAPKAIRDVEAYHLGCGRWRCAAVLPARRCRAGLARVGARVFAVGGFNGTLRVRSVDVYDARADSWAPGPPLTARRSTLGVAVIGNVIYAVGGFDGVTGLNTAEALDTSEADSAGAWRPIAPMSTRRSSVGVAVLDDRLYAVGGYDGASRQCLHTVERYDPATDTWEACPAMGARRSGAGVGAAGGALYAVGGHDGPAVRRSVERLRRGAAAWAPAPPMHTARRNAAVVAHAGRLYVVGGDDGAANLDTVEVFDPATETWTVLSERMSVGRSYAGVCVIRERGHLRGRGGRRHGPGNERGHGHGRGRGGRGRAAPRRALAGVVRQEAAEAYRGSGATSGEHLREREREPSGSGRGRGRLVLVVARAGGRGRGGGRWGAGGRGRGPRLPARAREPDARVQRARQQEPRGRLPRHDAPREPSRTRGPRVRGGGGRRRRGGRGARVRARAAVGVVRHHPRGAAALRAAAAAPPRAPRAARAPPAAPLLLLPPAAREPPRAALRVPPEHESRVLLRLGVGAARVGGGRAVGLRVRGLAPRLPAPARPRPRTRQLTRIPLQI